MNDYLKRGLCVMALSAASIAGFSVQIYGQDTKARQSKVSDLPLSDEQLAVYRAVLSNWMTGGDQPLNLANLTDAFPVDGPFDLRDCLKGLDLEQIQSDVVHRFRPEDVALLEPAKVRLVDREAQEDEVGRNDPGKAIRSGKSIDSALKNGFAHGLAWVSEIRFDKSHAHAVVFYGFRCGSLCGNGGTAILEKVNGVWTFKSECSNWMS
jgi:hypothetical protein